MNIVMREIADNESCMIFTPISFCNALQEGWINPSDGTAYWGTETHVSNIAVLEYDAPKWANRVYWFDK